MSAVTPCDGNGRKALLTLHPCLASGAPDVSPTVGGIAMHVESCGTQEGSQACSMVKLRAALP